MTPTIPVAFPAPARFVLALVVTAAAALLGIVDGLDDTARASIAGLIGIMATQGVVPLRPESLPYVLPAWVRLTLLFVVVAANIVISSVLGLSDVLTAVLLVVVQVAAALGILPPSQADPRSSGRVAVAEGGGSHLR